MMSKDFNAQPGKNLPFLKLKGVVKGYEWGRSKSNSILPVYAPHAELEKYAELWFGNHKDGESGVVIDNADSASLTRYLESDPSWYLGELHTLCNTGFSSSFELPFLLKVLSIGKPLSLQLHPSADEAELLHKLFPDHYPDPFDKPECAYALTNVELLCGFKKLQETIEIMMKVPDIHHYISFSPKMTVKDLYSGIISLTDAATEVLILNEKERISSKEIHEQHETLFLQLTEIYNPNDKGILLSYLLNHMKLLPSQVIFIPPNTVHAYISGELIECMNSSNNVARIGLTSKYTDQETALKILNFEEQNPKQFIIKPDFDEEGSTQTTVRIYSPPYGNFCFEVIELIDTNYEFSTHNYPEILFGFKGKSILRCSSLMKHTTLGDGDALFLPAGGNRYLLEGTEGSQQKSACVRLQYRNRN